MQAFQDDRRRQSGPGRPPVAQLRRAGLQGLGRLRRSRRCRPPDTTSRSRRTSSPTPRSSERRRGARARRRAQDFTLVDEWNPGHEQRHGRRRPPAGRRHRDPADAQRRARRVAVRRATSTASRPGHIALIQRGGCNFGVKVLNAKAAGATGVVIFNEGNPGRTGVLNGSLLDANNNPFVPTIPVAFTSFDIGSSALDAVHRREQNGTLPAHRHRHPDHHRPEPRRLERDRGVQGRRPEPRPRGRRAPGRDLRRGHARQRVGLRDDPRHRRADEERQPAEQAAVHLVRRRGAGSAGLAVLRQQPVEAGAEPHRLRPRRGRDGDAELPHRRPRSGRRRTCSAGP